jgi:hypothetical protein
MLPPTIQAGVHSWPKMMEIRPKMAIQAASLPASLLV